jgi:hypothetical protein
MSNQGRVSSFGNFASLHRGLVLLFELVQVGGLYVPNAFGKFPNCSAPF